MLQVFTYTLYKWYINIFTYTWWDVVKYETYNEKFIFLSTASWKKYNNIVNLSNAFEIQLVMWNDILIRWKSMKNYDKSVKPILEIFIRYISNSFNNFNL